MDDLRRYRTQLESLPVGLFRSTPDGRFVDANSAHVQLLGCPDLETLLATPVADCYMEPEEWQQWKAMVEYEEGARARDVRYRRFDGVPIWVREHIQAIRDDEGRVMCYDGVAIDITACKEMEVTLREQVEELAALQATVLDITVEHNLPTLLQTIVERAAHLLDAPGGGMYLCDAGRKQACCVVSYNTLDDYVGTVLEYGEGVVGTVAETEKPLLVEDHRTWDRRSAVYESDKSVVAILGVPMIWQGGVIGVIHVFQNVEGRHFTPADLELLTLFANHATIVVENARLYDEARRRATQLEALREVGLGITAQLDLEALLHSIASQAIELLGGVAGGFYLYRPERDVLEYVTSVGQNRELVPLGAILNRGEGLSGQVWMTNETLIVDDYQHWEGRAPQYDGLPIENVVGVPVRWGAEFLGVLTTEGEASRAFSPADTELLSLFASQAAIAIRNAQLYQETERRATQARLIYEVSQHVSSELDPNILLSTIVSAVRDAFDYHNVMLLLIDEGAHHLTMQSIAGAYADLFADGLSIAVGEGMIGCAAATGEVQFSNDVSTDPHYVRMEGEDTQSELAVPIASGQKVIGVLDLQDDERDAFDEIDVTTIETLSTQIATAIENAHLFQAERKRSAQLATVSMVVESIISTLDPHEVLRRTVELITQAFGYYYASIVLLDAETDELVFEVGAGGFASKTPPYFRQKVKEGMIGWAAYLGETLLANDVSQEPRYLITYLPETKSELDVPLRYRDRVIGVLDLQSRELNAFDEHDVMAMEALAGHIVAAIENARLYEETQQRALEQQTLREAALAMTTALERNAVLEHILAQLQEVVPYDTASIQLLRGDVLEIVGGRGFPNLQDLLGITFDPGRTDNPNREVVRTRAPLIVEDVPMAYQEFRREPHAPARIRSWLGVPMLVGDRLIGMIVLDKHEPGFYTTKHARLAEAFAAQAAVAIENARLFQAEREQREFSERLRRTALFVSSSLDLPQVLEMVLDQLAQVIHYDSGTIQILEQDATRVIATRNLQPSELGRRYPLQEFPYNRRLVEEGTPIVIDDVRENDQAWIETEGLEHVRSSIGVSLQVRGEVIGILTVDSCYPNAYTEHDARQVETFAQQAAVAIENARLFRAEKEQRELTEALEAAGAAVSSALDFDEVLDRILEQAARVVDGDAFNIMLVEDLYARIVRSRGYERFGVSDFVSSVSFHVPKVFNLWHMSESGKPIVIEDTTTYPGWVDVPAQRWLRSYVGVPIKTGETIVGFLNVDSSEPNHFSLADARRLEAFASHVAAAIENAQLYRELLGYADHLEERVTERTAQLRSHFARLEAILDSTVDGIVVTNADGELVQVNPVAQAWLTQTLSSEEAGLLHEGIRDLARQVLIPQPESRVDERPRKVLELTGLDLELSAAPIVGLETGQAEAVIAIHDVSHLKALDRVKSRFVSNVSHELRTPITTIKLYAHLMKKRPENWQDYLEPLIREADHQAQLVENILEISHVDAGRLEINPRRTDLGVLVRALAKSHATLIQERGLILEQRTKGVGPIAFLDSQRMMQVLNNLMENAIRYTPAGGGVTIVTDEVEAQGCMWATVAVKDTGIGIPEEELPHIFERFFRGEEPRTMQISGTGLGLAIVKEIVELHGGRVTVESEAGVGSTFTVWLPLVLNGAALQGRDDSS